MANERETGGPAFPSFQRIEEFDEDSGKYRDSYELMGGMELRDYFAAKALALDGQWFHINGAQNASQVAHLAYELADAMLKERAK